MSGRTEIPPGALDEENINVDASVASSTTAPTTPSPDTDTDADTWTYNSWLHEYENAKVSRDIKRKHLALTWQNLTVTGVDSKAVLSDNIISYINPLEYFKNSTQNARTTTIINNFNGQVKPGEMMLVLGRPGSGCTSFLRTVANKRKTFKHVDGEVFYGSMSSQEAHRYRGTVLYNSEEDMHFPTLTVAQTLALVIKTRVARHFSNRKSAKGHIKELLQVFQKALGISHTHATLVGNEFVRGVSGGERKRVSIGEVIAAQGSITCWDNPTRGLDASSALEFNQTLRSMADKAAVTVLVTLYQAGNGIFDLYDTVLVIDSGHQIYYGPRALAKKYFQDLGFICPPGANTADFLTSVTVPTERQIKSGYESTVPTAAADFEKIYLQSTIALEMRRNATPPAEFAESTALAKEAYHEEQPKYKSPIQSSYTVALHTQIKACVVRQMQIFGGDKMSMCLQQISAMLQALVSGSLYYNLPSTSAGLFTRSGALFFPIVLFNLTAMSEVTASFMGRPILARHRDFSLYRPTAYVIARMITDIPITILSCSIFSIVYYFMCGFQTTGGKFFTFWLLCIITALTFIAMYRAIGSLFRKFNDASKISGFWTMAMLVYAGYFIPYQNMHPWFRWIFWLSPAAYSYEAIMGNEFGGLELDCVGAQLIPNGPNYSTNTNHVCTVAGTSSDGSYIVGADYIHQAYDYQVGHIWRNFGILCAWWIVFTIATALALERPDDNHAASSLVYKRGSAIHDSIRKVKDEEKLSTGSGDDSKISAGKSSNGPPTTVGLVRNEAIFTWENLSYTVSVPGGQRKLLDNIFGWVKPGTLGALMGSSGAGKTTLLDVLAQRKDAGIIEGSILVDGRPLPVSFQRSAGYCEQMDVHEPTATVREALVFSARLRQPSETSNQEKRDYVDSIVDLLELHDIQDAIIGVPGAGLTIEQRKRVTIGVELAAKPSILLFLDEPTSGLDGQSAFNVIRFLRRLTAAGQAVLCTIHQPSALLFEAFDTLLLLAKGGKTVYFGETGTNSSTLLEYFSRNGAPCHPDVNPAEHIIDVVSGASGGGRDWNSVWLNSTERRMALQTLKELKSHALSKDATVNDNASDFATPLFTQLKLVTHRQQVAIWRNPDYVWNKIFIHVSAGLFCGFTFWKMGTAVADLQLRLLAVFNFLFVATGVINQLQPLFLHNRDIFEAREKKSKMYSWLAFVTAQLVAEIPYLVACGTLYFACWYFTAGLPVKASTSGQIYLIMILYEFLYTALGQAIAAISPNELFAALLNPLILGAFLINFAGVLVPYSQIVVFWKYWLYYLNPFTYLTGGLLTQLLYDTQVTCLSTELAVFSPPVNKTCGEYMSAFFETGVGYIVDNSSTTECQYCAYRDGAEYAKTLNLNARYYGWRDTGIVALFCISTYGVVFLMMKLRSKKTKSAKSE